MSDFFTCFQLHSGGDLYSFGRPVPTEYEQFKTYTKGMSVILVNPPKGFDARLTNCVAVVELILGGESRGTAVYFYLSVAKLDEQVVLANRRKRRIPDHKMNNLYQENLIKVSVGAIRNLNMDVLQNVCVSHKEPAFPDLDTERRKLAHATLHFDQMQQADPKRPKTHTDLVGKAVLKGFKDPSTGDLSMHIGVVTRVSTATGTAVYDFADGVTSTVKCLVRYEDGDSEHMTPAEVERLLV
jgi:hypothetical protein